MTVSVTVTVEVTGGWVTVVVDVTGGAVTVVVDVSPGSVTVSVGAGAAPQSNVVVTTPPRDDGPLVGANDETVVQSGATSASAA